MIMHDIALGLELIAAFLTVLFIGELLLQKGLDFLSRPTSGWSIYKRSLLNQRLQLRERPMLTAALGE